MLSRYLYLGFMLLLLDVAQAQIQFEKDIMVPFKEYCVECHGLNGKVKGDLDMLQIKNKADLTSDMDRLGAILDEIEIENMPPKKGKKMSTEIREKLVKNLDTIFDEAITKAKNVTSTPMRRMNRFQYNNAVVDLFQLKKDVFKLRERMLRRRDYQYDPVSKRMPYQVTVSSRPLSMDDVGGFTEGLEGVVPFKQDLRAEHGYDNQADHLSLSPLQMKAFLNLAHSIVYSEEFNEHSVGLWHRYFEPPEEKDAQEVIVARRVRELLNRAFRYPVEEETYQRFYQFAKAQIKKESDYTKGMKNFIQGVLASPSFLYLYNEASKDPLDLSDFELASRMSFFLWGSIPDNTLIDLATSKKLSHPHVLKEQVARMINDPKSERFVDSFPAQWLQLDRLVSTSPNREKFKIFYRNGPGRVVYRDSMHMMMEPLLMFETVMVEDRSILEFIDSNYTYRSYPLSLYYKFGPKIPMFIPESVSEFHRKKFADRPEVLAHDLKQHVFVRVPLVDRREGGVFTTAAAMAMTSSPDHSEPIGRGAWLATVLLNDPPPIPPDDVPPINEKDTAHLSIREKFKVHRENPNCAGCHNKLDPLGFAFENYDALGRWREVYPDGRKVDMAGTLFGKYPFKSVPEFKDVMLKEKNRFTRGFAKHLLRYALGRSINAFDEPSLDQIVERSAKDNYKLRSILTHVITSPSFFSKYKPLAEVSHVQ